jgi:hypothetical protein
MAVMALVLLWAGTGLGEDTATAPSKRTLNANRTLTYNVLPGEADSLAGWFTEGVFYGRVRINTFAWDWSDEGILRRDGWSTAIGGSLIYKTGYFKGFGATVDLYTSQNPWHVDLDRVKYLKSGKDVLSRHDVYSDDDYYMNVLAQAYGEFKIGKSSIRYGRQIFESLLTASNDTKMIPNTFEGLTLSSRDLDKTTIKLAWMTAQKLRDHTEFHDVLTYGDSSFVGKSGTEKALTAWSNNDDAGMHRGLSWDNYIKAGEDTEQDLLIAQVQNKSINHLKLMANYTAVPNVLSSATIEGHYTIPVGGFKLVPGVRYLNQFDDGGGDIGGASLTGLLADGSQNGGYDDPSSLDGWLVAARMDFKPDDSFWKFRLGYSHIGDEADIVAPWRGFPTGGFTRAMGQYNWFSNTDTWMLRGDCNFAKLGWVPGLKAMFRLAYQDYDDEKIALKKDILVGLEPTDRTVLHLDFIEKLPSLPDMELRLRMAFVGADDTLGGTDPSYSEYRLELNYLF